MAWLQTYPSGVYHLNFSFGGEKFRRSLKTKSKREADARLQRLEENIRLVDNGRLEIPTDADVATFLLSDGRLDRKPKVKRSFTLADLFTKYFNDLPDDALEDNTLRGMQIHQRHLERKLGRGFKIQGLSRDDLQAYVNKRSRDKGLRGRNVSSTTIRKEIATLRAIWNWARGAKLVLADFPNKGLRYPKLDEKPRFQTWDEISVQCDQGYLSDAEVADLWDCLFLQGDELEELLKYVRLSTAQPFLYPMVATAAHTGARRSELLRSELSDIDGTHLTIREKKRVKGKRSTRRVPISAPLRNVLDEWRAIHPGGRYTFCMPPILRSNAGRTGVEPVSRDEAQDHFQRLLEGSQWEVIRGWHIFRHSFISLCAMKGIDQRLIDNWVGHCSEDMRKRYRHLVPSHELAVLGQVFS